MTHARVCCEDSAQRKTNKMALEITLVADKEIQFLSSVSLPNLKQALGENFLDSDSWYEDYTSDSDDGSENILDKSCGEDASDRSDGDFPVRRMKRFAGKTGVELRKNSWRWIRQEKGKDIPKIYFLWERTEIEGQLQRLLHECPSTVWRKVTHW